MRYFLIALGVASCAVLGGHAMAQAPGAPRYANTPGSEFTAQPGAPVGSYEPNWSRNPGVFNDETSRPNFVDHSHGHT